MPCPKLTGDSLAGYSYHKYYKYLVLNKIDNAFEPGDPALEIAGVSPGKEAPDTEHWVVRDEQEKIDRIVAGDLKGHYYLLVGEKGTGKTSMLLNAMQKVNGRRVAMFEAHADLEIFRVRFGKCLDFEFHEEYVMYHETQYPALILTLFFLAILAVFSVSEDRVIRQPCWTLNALLTS